MNDTAQRLQQVRADMTAQGLQAMVVSEPGNRRWLTGFTGSAGWPVVLADDAFLLTDSRYYEQVERESAPTVRLERAPGRPLDRLAELLMQASASRVGLERDIVTVGQLDLLRSLEPEIEWVPVAGIVEPHRAVKTEAEIDLIRAAVDLGDRAMELAYASCAPGMTERDLAWLLERFMREHGAECVAFDVIVGAGEDGALPHHTPSDRPVQLAEPIVIDLGARVNGYNGDLTRTFSLGVAADAEYPIVYDVVDRAGKAAQEAVRAGITCRALDEVARSVIRDAGYGDYFGHGLGHGVGLNVHEAPRVGPAADDDVLREGMVVTIEPGIYLPGRFGVRIEDLVVVRVDHAEVLSGAGKIPVVAAD
jgi:Xaa-Pro aminopeptidase